MNTCLCGNSLENCAIRDNFSLMCCKCDLIIYGDDKYIYRIIRQVGSYILHYRIIPSMLKSTIFNKNNLTALVEINNSLLLKLMVDPDLTEEKIKSIIKSIHLLQ